MKKFAFTLTVLAAMFAAAGCNNGTGGGSGGGGNTTYTTKKFWAQNITTETFYQIDAEKLAENSRCEVWVEKGSGVTAATASSVASAYSTVYTKMMNTFGYTVNDKDLGKVDTMQIAHWIATGKTSGAKLTLLLLDIKDGYKPGVNDAYVGGYFYALDLMGNDPKYPNYKSNKLDMIYLDTYPAEPGSDLSNGTLAHEMQHLMNFVSSVVFRVNNNTLYLTDTWVDEGLSSAAEWVYTGNHGNGRLKDYNEDYSGLLAKGNSFYMWDNHKDNQYAILDDYSTVYLFFQYLRLQSGKPNDIYFDILSSGFSDYQAVTTAANINSSHKNNWPLLLRDWYAANYTNAASGLYGYKNDLVVGELTVKAPTVPAGTSSLPLFPGEGVYSKTTTLPSDVGNIKYTALSSSTNGNAILTYNVNTDNKNGAAETGTIASSVGISIPSGSGSVQMSPKKLTGPFKVDAGYFLRRNGSGSMPNVEMREVLDTNSRSVNKDSNTVKFDLSTLERVFIDE